VIGRRHGPAAGRLDHVRKGEGEPLLLLHSLGGSRVQWSPVIEALAAEREAVAVDMPGFGDSPPLPDGIEPSAANLATAVLDFCESLGLDGAPHVAGISLGGWVALECARQGGARSVVALCPAGFWAEPLAPSRNTARMAAHALRPLIPALRLELLKRRALAGTVRHPERVPGSEAVEMIRAYAKSPAYPEASRLMRAGVVGDLSDVRVPVTLAWSEFDARVRREPLRKGILPSRVRQVALPGCGHVPTWDDPDLVAQVVLDGTARRR
jgi:pimeloyl-ACP methyl ester carboxylesterase